MQGDPDGSFRPLEEMTRQEFATVLSRVLQLNTQEVKRSSYHDVSGADWGFKQIHAVRSAGLMLGDTTGNFHPNSLITREEMAVVLVRAAQVDPMGYGVRLKTADAAEVSDWARDSVQAAIELGLMRGDGTRFYPQDTAKREEVAVVALDLFRKTQETPTPIVEEIVGNTVQMNGHVYQITDSLKGLFKTANAAFLVGSKVKFEKVGDLITKVTYLESGKNGVSLDAGNSVIEGDVLIRGHEVHLDNLRVTKSIQFSGNGQQHVVVGNLSAQISELRNPQLQLELTQKTQFSGMRVFADSSLVTGGAVIPKIILEDGVQNLHFVGDLGTVVYNSKADMILTGNGNVEEVQLDGSGELTLTIDGRIKTATVDNAAATCVLNSKNTIVEKLVLNYGQSAGGVVDNFSQAKDQILVIIIKGSGSGGGSPGIPQVNKPPQSKANLLRTLTLGGPGVQLLPTDLATDMDGDLLSFAGVSNVSDASKAVVAVNPQGLLEVTPLMQGDLFVTVNVTDSRFTTPVTIQLKIQPQPDIIAPVVTGVVDNQTYTSAVVPNSSDTDIQTVSLTQNGTVVAGYTLGTPISQDGNYLLTVTDQAGNSTTVHFVVSIDMSLPVVAGVLDNQAYHTPVTPTSPETDIATVALTLDGLVVAGYELGTPITQDGSYVLTVTDLDGKSTVVHFSIDTVAPVVTGVVDSQTYTSVVTPSSVDSDIQSVQLTRDGTSVAGYALGTGITTDGEYVLTVTDRAGNSTVVHFSLNMNAPVVMGVLDAHTYSTAVTPTSSDTDIQTITLTQDGINVVGYSLGTAITQDGSYVLTVTDLAGHSTVLHFVIDSTIPVVTGLVDNQIYTTAVTPDSIDTDIQTVTLTKNGSVVAGYSLGTAISGDGSYVLTVTDQAGGSSVIHFTIDTAAPVVTGVLDNQTYGTSVTPVSGDSDLQTVTLTLDGTPVSGYTLGTTITADGTYELTVTDHAGNSSVFHFIIDKTSPVVSGVVDNHIYGTSVTPVSSDTDITTVTLTQDGTAVAGYTLG
ncbi:S-layer homology domain-containing protein, partial [Tumebacillus permanentifrigoris]